MAIRKILIDYEGAQGIPGISLGDDIEIIPSGKQFVYTGGHEQDQPIYTLLREHCDIHFLEESQTKNLRFYPVPLVSLFAHDSRGNYFGTLEGVGGIEDREHTIIFINEGRKTYGKVADNLKAFLSLVNYYPHWQRVIEKASEENFLVQCDMRSLELSRIDIEKQHEIEVLLSLSKDPDAIERLIEKVRGNPWFVVYESKEEAEKEHEFIAI